MSVKRFKLKYSNHDGSCVILDNGDRLDSHEVADLLNQQAETIEVLREENDDLKRRLAALEGK